MKTILAFVALSLVLAFPASAQVLCAPNKPLAAKLKERYGEVPAVTAMRADGVPVMIFANPETGTFTMVAVGPEASCFMVTGKDMEIIMRGDPA